LPNRKLRNDQSRIDDVTTSAPLQAERVRLAALRRYAVLGTPREESFDRLARLAARVMETPIAAVGLVDIDRVWFKAEIGLGAAEMPRQLAMCNRAIASEAAFYELSDTSTDRTLAGNPLLEPPVGIRFYAGAALVTPDGFRIGTLCVIDRRARPGLTAEQRATLTDLAGTVMTELERRRQQSRGEAARARRALINDVLAQAGGATGFVAAIETTINRLCRHTGAINGQLWAKGAGRTVRALAFATDGDVTAERRAAFFRLFADRSRTGIRAMLPPDGRVVMVPEVTPERAAKWPLMRYGYERGMRAFLLQPLTVGGERFGLVLNFGTPRTDLPEVAELLAEVGQAIRPALHRKQAEDRLALLNAILAEVGGAAGFVAAIEAAMRRLCVYTGAAFAQLWEQAEGASVRLVAFAADHELTAEFLDTVFRLFPSVARQTDMGPLLAADAPVLAPSVAEEQVAHLPLLHSSWQHGMRSYLIHKLPVGAARYALILKFDTERRDLPEIAALLNEVGQAIRPALLRKQAEERLALLNDVLAVIAGAPNLSAGIEGAIALLCRHAGAYFGHLWDQIDQGRAMRLLAQAGPSELSPVLRELATQASPVPTETSLLAPLMATGGRQTVPSLPPRLTAPYPLLHACVQAGLRSMAAQAFAVADTRYMLVLGFAAERGDLDAVADLLGEMAQAIRPAMLRRMAEDRLALTNDVLACVADAPGFRVAIEATLERLGTHVGALWGLIWEKTDETDELRLTGAHGGPKAPSDFPAIAAAAFPMPASDSLLASLLETEGSRIIPQVTDAMAARHPLIRVGRDAGMRSFAAQSLMVGPRRYVLCFTFDRERRDLDQIVALLAEIGHAIRPALQRKQAEERLAAVQESLQDRTAELTELARLARIGSWSWRAEGNVIEWSDETYEVFGVSRADFTPTADGFFALLHPEDAMRARLAGRHAIRTGQVLHVEARVPAAGGRTRTIVWSATARRSPDGRVTELRGYCQDVTERRETEAALRHGEKLRALGKLTGGIAHEFNNLLTIVQANLELALDPAETLADARPELEAAHRAVQAGTELTARLLSVARSEPLRREATDLAALLRPLQEMATRTLGSRYRLALTTADLPPVSVDRSQLEGAVLNLILNARDAMAMGGPIAIETARLRVPPGARGALAELAAGEYAELSVRDRGLGMAPDVAEHAFEPFFTTKPAGSGTGLGLSMVLSFARQSGGTALIETNPGYGTTVRIVLPLA
jgi:PAS domain S-box-containing protein